jgi:hypothetical protein
MTAFIELDELAEAVLPDRFRRKVFALLHAYFDESGIHRGSPVILFELDPPIRGLSGYHTPASLIALLEKADSDRRVFLKTIPKRQQPRKPKKRVQRKRSGYSAAAKIR